MDREPEVAAHARSTPATRRKAPSVFISYAHEDKPLVRSLAQALRRRGCRVWTDEGEMRIGDRLLDRIAAAIADMDFLVAIVSEASVNSSWCRKELPLAMSGELARAHVGVLPIRLGGVQLPPSLVDVFAPRIDPDDIPAMATQLVSSMKSHGSPHR